MAVDAPQTLHFEDFDQNCTNHEVEVIFIAFHLPMKRLQRLSEVAWAMFVLALCFRAELPTTSKCLFCFARFLHNKNLRRCSWLQIMIKEAVILILAVIVFAGEQFTKSDQAY